MAVATVDFSIVFFTYFSLTTFSINSLQLLLFAIVLHSPPNLLTQSSQRILGLPRLIFLPLSGHLISLPVFHFPFFPYGLPFQHTPHQVLLTHFLHSNLQIPDAMFLSFNPVNVSVVLLLVTLSGYFRLFFSQSISIGFV